MDINTYHQARELLVAINDAERKLNNIKSMFDKDKELYIGDGRGRKFEIPKDLELKIKHLIKESYWNEFKSLSEEFKDL